jgi:predicted secreted protein
MKIAFFLSLALAAIWLAGPSEACAAEQAATIFTDGNNNKVVDLAVGQRFCVELVSNPSTGYDWHLSSLEKTMLSLPERDFKASKTKLNGAPGVAVWCFSPLAEGQTRLQLSYYRVWEGAGTAVNTFTLDLRVAPAK